MGAQGATYAGVARHTRCCHPSNFLAIFGDFQDHGDKSITQFYHCVHSTHCFSGELIKHYTVSIYLLILLFISTYLGKLDSINSSRWRHVNVDGMIAAKYLTSQHVGGTSGGTLATSTCHSSSVLNIIIGVKCWSF